MFPDDLHTFIGFGDFFPVLETNLNCQTNFKGCKITNVQTDFRVGFPHHFDHESEIRVLQEFGVLHGHQELGMVAFCSFFTFLG